MKGIILAGGSGTRLHPVTQVVSKHLLPIYDKPMVYYPLSTLMLGGIREILLISTPRDLPMYKELLGDGSRYGLRIEYAEQPNPDGLAQAFIIGRDFIGDDDVTLILGDNVFYGHDLSTTVATAIKTNDGATVFGYYVNDPSAYGVAEFDDSGRVIALHEKPAEPPSHHAIVGLYIYSNDVVEKAAGLAPSPRGELEITDLNNRFISENRLRLAKLGRGIAWLDTGTHDAMVEASSFMATIERRQGLKVACLEEVAFRMGFIDLDSLKQSATDAPGRDQRDYLRKIVQEAEVEKRRSERPLTTWGEEGI